MYLPKLEPFGSDFRKLKTIRYTVYLIVLAVFPGICVDSRNCLSNPKIVLSKQLSPCLLLTWQWRRSPDHWASTDWCSRCCCRWGERCRHWPGRSRCCCWCYCSGYWLRNCRSGAAKWREGNWYSRSDCPCHSWCSGGSFSRMPYLKWK